MINSFYFFVKLYIKKEEIIFKFKLSKYAPTEKLILLYYQPIYLIFKGQKTDILFDNFLYDTYILYKIIWLLLGIISSLNYKLNKNHFMVLYYDKIDT